MDILISSNLERLVYLSAGNDADRNRAFMESLGGQGRYEITEDMKLLVEDRRCADFLHRPGHLHAGEPRQLIHQFEVVFRSVRS